MKLRVAACVVGVVLALATEAAGEPPLRLVSGARCTTGTGVVLTLDPESSVLQPGQWDALDESLKASQTAETRLTAENRKLRELAARGPGWGVVTAVGVSLAVGFAAGAYVTSR